MVLVAALRGGHVPLKRGCVVCFTGGRCGVGLQGATMAWHDAAPRVVVLVAAKPGVARLESVVITVVAVFMVLVVLGGCEAEGL